MSHLPALTKQLSKCLPHELAPVAPVAPKFVPRSTFPTNDSIPRSYFLGHHLVGLRQMKTMLSSIDVVIECRDYRLPLTSRNPLLEESLAGRRRLIVYTKRDLGGSKRESDDPRIRHPSQKTESKLREWHRPTPVFFSDYHSPADIRLILKHGMPESMLDEGMPTASSAAWSVVGSRALIVGMPNVGKSSLLNALRQVGLGRRAKAAPTGVQPGVTRKIGTSVKILQSADGHSNTYVVDTPGVFVPYVPDADAMLKLMLCGNVKDGLVLPVLLADYLLYHLNRNSPERYAAYHEPTNDIVELLTAVAHKTGRLRKGGEPDLDASALWLVQRWRSGALARFVLDDLSDDALERARAAAGSDAPVSYSQRLKLEKEARMAKSRLKRTGV